MDSKAPNDNGIYEAHICNHKASQTSILCTTVCYSLSVVHSIYILYICGHLNTSMAINLLKKKFSVTTDTFKAPNGKQAHLVYSHSDPIWDV